VAVQFGKQGELHMFCLHDVCHGVMSADVPQAKHWGGIMNMTAGLAGLISQLRQLQCFQKIATLQVSHPLWQLLTQQMMQLMKHVIQVFLSELCAGIIHSLLMFYVAHCRKQQSSSSRSIGR
jgi:hypothetical protein